MPPRRRRRHTARLSAVAALAALLGVLAPAAAAERYVDDGGTDSSNDCTQPASPCRSIAYAISQAASGETVVVGGGTYEEALTLGGGKSLRGSSFKPPSTDGLRTLAVTPGTTAVEVPGGQPTSTIQGLTFEQANPSGSSTAPWLALGSPAVVDHNAILLPPGPSEMFGVLVGAAAGGSVISGNAIVSLAGDRAPPGGVALLASARISGNFFSRIHIGASVAPGTSPTIVQNTFTGIGAERDSQGALIEPGVAVLVHDAALTLRDNLLKDSSEDTVGVRVVDDSGVPAVAALTSQANRIFGIPTGIELDGVGGNVTLDGDIVAGGSGSGLLAKEGTGPLGGISAQNVTLMENSPDVSLIGDNVTTPALHLALDSSIVSNPIARAGDASCSIAFSRGPSTGTGCAGFQTTAVPEFLDTNYHLDPGSPLVDRGNPAAPPVKATDPDGDPRAIDGDKDCVARRDIGADEVEANGAQPNCSSKPPAGAQGSLPADKLAPVISDLSLTHRVFRVAARGQVALRPKGTTFRFRLSEAAEVKIAIARRSTGVRVGGSCRRATRRNRVRRRCIRWVAVTRLARNGPKGANRVPFSGRYRRGGRVRELRPGRYRATLTAIDAAGNRSRAKRVRLRIVAGARLRTSGFSSIIRAIAARTPMNG